MQENWIRVYTSDKAYEIEFVITLLEEEGIPSFKIDKKDSSYAFGDIELYVQAPDEANAKLILIENNLL